MVRHAKNGATWRIGTDAEVAWIANGTSIGRAITAAIPPVFEAYATVVLPERGEGQDTHDRAVLALLREQSAGQPWWLGYLDTGADDIVFPDAPKVILYSGWRYVLVEAGSEQAATWRQSGPRSFWKGALPNLMFPADRSWLVSTLWDDDWTCIGGPAGLVDEFARHPGLEARRVALGEDARPPGHQALLRIPPSGSIDRGRMPLWSIAEQHARSGRCRRCRGCAGRMGAFCTELQACTALTCTGSIAAVTARPSVPSLFRQRPPGEAAPSGCAP